MKLRLFSAPSGRRVARLRGLVTRVLAPGPRAAVNGLVSCEDRSVATEPLMHASARQEVPAGPVLQQRDRDEPHFPRRRPVVRLVRLPLDALPATAEATAPRRVQPHSRVKRRLYSSQKLRCSSPALCRSEVPTPRLSGPREEGTALPRRARRAGQPGSPQGRPGAWSWPEGGRRSPRLFWAAVGEGVSVTKGKLQG